MRFQHNGENYELGFEYTEDNKGRRVTTARLTGVDVVEASATCSKEDRFEYKIGRQEALKRLYQKLPQRTLRQKVSHVYYNR